MIIITVNVIYSSIGWHKELDHFKSLKINSKLYGLRNIKRGNYEIKIKYNDTLLAFDLPIAYDIDKFKIQNGDSLTKEANIGVFDIYRKDSITEKHLATVTIY